MDKETSLVLRTKGVKENFITVNNCLIRYLTAGTGDPLILIHTMRTQSDYFQKIIPELSSHYSIYAIDLPGHGRSGLPKRIAYTEQYFMQTVRRFMDTLHLNNVTVVGESFGATIALTLAASDENRTIRKVFAFNPYDYGKRGGIIRSSKTARNVFSLIQLPLIGTIVSQNETDGILRKIIYGGLNRKNNLSNELLATLAATRKRKGFPNAFKSMSRHWESWIAARDLYSQIKIPVALVYSESDWSTEVERKANQELIPQCNCYIMRNTGHFSCIDNPTEVLKIILSK
ncbi:MAG: alpha/beta hydrolase [Ferruginibacter sp.]